LLPAFEAKCDPESAASATSTECKDIKKHGEEALDQKQLFNMIRRGVVTINVTAYVILEKYTNDKAWWGTGFIVDLEKGLIVTNAHIAGEMSVCTYEVKFGNGQKAEAKLEYLDPYYDFAILSVDKKVIPNSCIALKYSDKPISINSTVYSMGNSAGDEFSVYQGYIFDNKSIFWLKPLPEQSFQPGFAGIQRQATGSRSKPVVIQTAWSYGSLPTAPI
jgi:S1-C subfamily serine protease